MTKLDSIIVEISSDLTSKVDALSAVCGRSNAEVVNDAVEQYLANRERWQSDMDAASVDIENGTGYDGDEVLAWIESWGTHDEKPRPKLTPIKP